MANMSHCRFSNTLDDLEDCYEALKTDNITLRREARAAKALIELCRLIAKYTAEEVDEMYAMNAEDDF